MPTKELEFLIRLLKKDGFNKTMKTTAAFVDDDQFQRLRTKYGEAEQELKTYILNLKAKRGLATTRDLNELAKLTNY